MRRLFSTFASGTPGVGLLLMRAAAGGVLVAHGLATLDRALPFRDAAPPIAMVGVGAMLLIGLWTPIAGLLAAAAAAWIAITGPGDLSVWFLVGTVGIAAALAGPGAWSVDAFFFGWKRLDIGKRNGSDR